MRPTSRRVGAAELRVVDATISGRLLLTLLLRKIARRVGLARLGRDGRDTRFRPAISYGGLVVYDREELDGAGIQCGSDYPRVLLTLGIGRCDRVFELCAGPAYIGYFLLSLGFGESLALADINPDAVAAARYTAERNGLTDRVSIWESDLFANIPHDERWDLVVGNPPHFLPDDWPDADIRAVDPEWELHRRFYAGVRRFMRPGGHVVLVENAKGSSVDDFEPMIAGGGGEFVATMPGIDVRGQPNGYYFIASRW